MKMNTLKDTMNKKKKKNYRLSKGFAIHIIKKAPICIWHIIKIPSINKKI